MHDSILRAAPVLATLQTLADAEARAATDPLTGLGNRRLVEDALSRAAAQAQRTGDGFAVAMIDVDRFKRVNDTFGHEAGDALLGRSPTPCPARRASTTSSAATAVTSSSCCSPDSTSLQATIAMERCRARIAALAIGTPPVSATASFGVAASPPGGPYDPTALVRAADEAVYEAKARGGDTVVGRTLANV